jgi:hypothetical protein
MRVLRSIFREVAHLSSLRSLTLAGDGCVWLSEQLDLSRMGPTCAQLQLVCESSDPHSVPVLGFAWAPCSPY